MFASLASIVGTGLSGCSAAQSLHPDGGDGDPDTDTGRGEDAGGDAGDGGVDAREASAGPVQGPARGSCWTVAPVDGSLLILEVDFEAAEWREVGRWGDHQPFEVGGLAVVGSVLLVLDHFTPVVVDLVSGHTTVGSEAPGMRGLAVSDGVIGSLCPRATPSLCLYSSLDAVLLDEPERIVRGEFGGSQLAMMDGEAYLMEGIAADVVRVVHATSGTLLQTLDLLEFAGWVGGVAVLGDTIVVLTGSGDTGVAPRRMVRFSLATGERLDEVVLDVEVSGPGAPGGVYCAQPTT